MSQLTLGTVPEADDLLSPVPEGVDGWSENFFFHPYDHRQNIGFALHLGRAAQDPWMFREMVYVYLPDGRALAAKGFGRRETPRGPAGANLHFSCDEPFRRWRIRYDAAARWVRPRELLESPMRDGFSVPLSFDLVATSLTPPWAANTALPAEADKRGQASFGGAFSGTDRFHYEQVARVVGTLSYGGREFQIDAVGFRDHTRGVRKFGGRSGHTLLSCRFPDGFTAGLYQVRDEAGTPQFNQAFTVDGGVLDDAVVLDAPVLERAAPPEHFVVELDTISRGRIQLIGHPLNYFPQTICTPNDLLVGLDTAAKDDFSCLLMPSRIEMAGGAGEPQVGGGHLELSLWNQRLG